MRVPAVKADFHTREARLLEKIFQVHRSRHLSWSIFNRQSDAALARKQGQVFERTERRIPLPLVRRIARPRHVLDAVAEGDVLDQVQRALDFVERLLPPQTLWIADRERRAAFPRQMEIARRRRMNGVQREAILREPTRQFAGILRRAVIEMPARTRTARSPTLPRAQLRQREQPSVSCLRKDTSRERDRSSRYAGPAQFYGSDFDSKRCLDVRQGRPS